MNDSNVGVRALVVLAAVAALVTSSASVHAQPAAGNQARAEALFEEGKKLMDGHRFDEACARFAESDKTAASGGAIANLADCFEARGMAASAIKAFAEAKRRAVEAKKNDIVQFLDERIAKLAPKVSHLVLVLPAGNAFRVHVTVDGTDVDPAAFGGYAVDPGAHAVDATGLDAPFQRSVVVAGDGARVTVELRGEAPAIAPAPVAPTPAPPPGRPAATGAAQRVVGLTVGGVGAATMIVGGVFGFIAKSKNDDAIKGGCQGQTCTTQQGVQLTNDARSAGNVSTALFIGGGVVLAAGVVVWLIAPRAPASSQTAGWQQDAFVVRF